MADALGRLRDGLGGDRPVVSSWIGTPGRAWIEQIAGTPYGGRGFDAVTIDMQHGMHGEEGTLAAIASVAMLGKPAIVRIPVGRFDLASRVLDAGAHGVIAPMINSVEDARAFAAHMKYPPMGERSFGATFAARNLRMAGPDYVPRANAETLAIAMIETREAFEAADEILALDGIDAVFMGPSDFSISIRGGGMPEAFGADTAPMIEELAEKARRARKIAAVFAYDAKAANRAHAMGYRLIALGLDSAYLAQGIEPLLGGLEFGR